jgi:hypothetical protein
MISGPDRPTSVNRANDQRQGHVSSPLRALAVAKKTIRAPESSFARFCLQHQFPMEISHQ